MRRIARFIALVVSAVVLVGFIGTTAWGGVQQSVYMPFRSNVVQGEPFTGVTFKFSYPHEVTCEYWEFLEEWDCYPGFSLDISNNTDDVVIIHSVKVYRDGTDVTSLVDFDEQFPYYVNAQEWAWIDFHIADPTSLWGTFAGKVVIVYEGPSGEVHKVYLPLITKSSAVSK